MPGTARVSCREPAVRQLTAIPQTAALTILRAMTPLGDDDPRRPDANIKKLAGYQDRYRLRAGDYRVIYDITDAELIILVTGVGHRRAWRGLATPHSLRREATSEDPWSSRIHH